MCVSASLLSGTLLCVVCMLMNSLCWLRTCGGGRRQELVDDPEQGWATCNVDLGRSLQELGCFQLSGFRSRGHMAQKNIERRERLPGISRKSWSCQHGATVERYVGGMCFRKRPWQEKRGSINSSSRSECDGQGAERAENAS